MVLTSLVALNALPESDVQIRGIELKLRDPADAVRIAELLGSRLRKRFDVVDWCSLNQELFGC